MLAQVSHSMSAVWLGVLAVLAQVSHSTSAVWLGVLAVLAQVSLSVGVVRVTDCFILALKRSNVFLCFQLLKQY